jgi:hypothetical protein
VCFLASVLVLRLRHGRCSHNEGEREHRAPHCETSLINQSLPHEIDFSKRPALLEAYRQTKIHQPSRELNRRTSSHL